MPYSCKTLIKTDQELASREKRLSICLGANGFSFTETSTAGILLSFGEVEGEHAETMTEVMKDLKSFFASAGIQPLGYASSELIVLTEEGIVILASLGQLLKASFPIFETPSEIRTVLRDVQESKALSPILITLSGIVMLTRDAQAQNAFLPIVRSV